MVIPSREGTVAIATSADVSRSRDALFGRQSVDQFPYVVVDGIERRLEHLDIRVPVHRYPS